MAYSPGRHLSARKSLAVIGRPVKTRFYVRRTSTSLTLRTTEAGVTVNLASGRLTFLDAAGRPSLREAKRSLNLVRGGSDRAYRIDESFIPSKNEAFYGLGCLQEPDLDYTGKSFDLYQHNMFQVNPVIVSSEGYGLLWDNASETKVDFGDSSSILSEANLYTVDKKPGGLNATYFSGQDLTTVDHTAIDSKIDFDWKGKENFSARWEGYVKTGVAGVYRFATKSDDGARLWVNGKLIVDDWKIQPATEESGTIRLPANSLVPIKVEYFQNLRDAVMALSWAPPTSGRRLALNSEIGDQLDFYYIAGPKLDDVVGGYRKLTGQAPMFGKWAYGFWQCKERYQTQQELLNIAAEYRKRRIPIDNLVQDWFYWDPYKWGSHKFDPKRYPDPASLLRQLHDEHIHLMISVWAKFEPGSENFEEMKNGGYLLPDNDGQNGTTRYYDPFNPKARATYWKEMRDELFRYGFDAWWLDASEPEMDHERLKTFPTGAGRGDRVLNAYPLMHTTSVYKGQRATTDKKRVFILTRSVFAGQQRNAAACWSGDITASWETFRKQIASGLNFCIAGVPYWCTDIGAFFGANEHDPAYQELFVRWFEWGTFCPIFRVHGTGANKELWRFGPANEKILVKYDNLRYRLMPYIYSLAHQVTASNSTMMRALPMDYRADRKTWRISDQFSFGPSLMIAPVVSPGATSRTVYLPKGTSWTDFWTGARHAGGHNLVESAPLGTLPLLVPAGSIVPLGPLVQYASEKPADPIELRVYSGANGHFTLYEDEGDGYGYERGRSAAIPISWDDKAHRLTIGQRKGHFPGMLTNRTFRIVVVRPGHGTGIGDTPKADQTVRYNGYPLTLEIKG